MRPGQYNWVIVDDVAIAVGTHGKLPEETWKIFVSELATRPVKKFIALIIGSTEVTSVQRKMGIDVISRRRIKVSIINDSSVIRGIVTAASWFGADVKSFPSSQVREAVQELGVPPSREDAIIQELEKLRTSLL